MPYIIKWSILDGFQEIREDGNEVMEVGMKGWRLQIENKRSPMYMSDVCGQTRREN